MTLAVKSASVPPLATLYSVMLLYNIWQLVDAGLLRPAAVRNNSAAPSLFCRIASSFVARHE
jgi:hypothetical protein